MMDLRIGRTWRRALGLFLVLVGIWSISTCMGRKLHPAARRIVFTQIPPRSESEIEGDFAFPGMRPEGARIVVLAHGDIRVLTEGFAAACDPDLSFDGTRVLFSGKRAEDDRWNIWEMDLDGGRPRQITSDLGDCAEPIYLAMASVTPPTFEEKVRWIAFTSTDPGMMNERGSGPLTSLYVMSLSPIKGRGPVIWRITYDLGGDVSPTVLSDGRVLFSSWQRDVFGLMTVTWGGDNLNPFYGNHGGPAMKTMACEMPGRRALVFVESDGKAPGGGGRLVQVSFRRPLHSHEVLSKGGGYYKTPHPLPNDGLMVSYTPGEESYGVYTFDLEKGKPGDRIYDDPDWDDVDAMPVVPRAEPLARIPMVEFASVLDIKGFSGAGQLHCLNIYDSDRPEVAQLEPGQVKWARFVEGVGIPTEEDKEVCSQASSQYASTWPPPCVQPRILGEAPVEEDGSFFVNIVGNTPYYIQILDEERMALYTMRAWAWMRSRAQRGCIGCHEDKELAPENRVTQALLKMAPAYVTASPQERRTVVFRRDVMPIVETRCAGCHRATPSPGGLDLGGGYDREEGAFFNRAYESLLASMDGKPRSVGGKYVHPGDARNSPLIWKVYGWQVGRQYEPAPYTGPTTQMPPKMPLSDEERRAFVEWVDLGARWDDALK